MKIFLKTFLFLLSVNSLLAQVPDSVQRQGDEEILKDTIDLTEPIVLDSTELVNALNAQDTSKKKRGFLVKFLKDDYPNPKKAALLSIIPGGGQLYNKRYWKLPFVYAAYGGIGYYMIYNINRRKSFNAAYAQRLELSELPPCDDLCQQIVASNLSTESVKARRATQLKQLQLSYIGVFAVVVLTAAESFVDAHLRSFDVSDDLSLQFKPIFDASVPSIVTGSAYGTAGIGLIARF